MTRRSFDHADERRISRSPSTQAKSATMPSDPQSLASFLASVRAAIPAGSQLVLARPRPMTHRALQLTGMEKSGQFATATKFELRRGSGV